MRNLNNKKEKSSYKLKKNDKIDLHDFNFSERTNKKRKFIYNPTKKELSFSSRIFIENNKNFVVINKPSGISVQSGTKSRKNILDILRKTQEFKDTSPYTVHRIDKETSGILVVAKNRKYAQLFTSLFRIRKIHKTYLGIVLGELNENKGTLIDILFHYEGKKKIKAKAITRFNVIDSNNNYSLFTDDIGLSWYAEIKPILSDTTITDDVGNINTYSPMVDSVKLDFVYLEGILSEESEKFSVKVFLGREAGETEGGIEYEFEENEVNFSVDSDKIIKLLFNISNLCFSEFEE